MRLPAVDDKVRSRVRVTLTDGRRVFASSSHWPWLLRMIFRRVKSGRIPVLTLHDDEGEDIKVTGPMIADVLVARFDGGEPR
jgi:hypothetical protein